MSRIILFAQYQCVERFTNKFGKIAHRVHFGNIRSVRQEVIAAHMTTPFYKAIEDKFYLLKPGDDVIMRVIHDKEQYFVECCYILPYWYKNEPYWHWDGILDTLMSS